jgi:hypothetical protein
MVCAAAEFCAAVTCGSANKAHATIAIEHLLLKRGLLPGDP